MKGKEITAIKDKVKAIYRFIGKDIYIKTNSYEYAAQLLKQLESKGGKFQKGRQWIKVDFFGNNDLIKIGGIEMDKNETPEANIQEVFFSFFRDTLNSAKFKIEVKQI